jgi:hypothetical protein
MKRIDVERKEINKKDYIRRTARLSDVSRHIKEDAIVYHNGKPILLYKVLSTPPKDVRWAVKNINYQKRKRTHGLQNTSAVFGYNPRQEKSQDFCSASAMGYDQPKQHYIITNFAKQIQKYYKDYFQETYKQHKEKVKEKVKDQWVIKDTVFTSGIVNKNNQLKYHFDSGNFKNVYSNMLVFKSDVMGGHLVIPEIDISLEVADNSVTIFDGQDLLHGVSPIDYNNSKAYRYSIVYYSLERMWQCLTIEEEVDRIREKKMIREENRLKPEHLDILQQRKKQAQKYKQTIENEQK